MSETNTTPPGEGGTAPAPEPTPAPAPAPAPAPEPDAPDQAATPEQKAEQDRDQEGRRIAQMRARLAATERENQRLQAETEYYRRNTRQVPEGPETPEQTMQRLKHEARTEAYTQIRTETFHEAGNSQYTDWRQRCDDLMKMGADPGFAQLLVEMPDGVKVTAALAADPDEVQRIASLRTATARSVALGKYAATLEDSRGAAKVAPITKAPPPVRTVSGRASPTPNEYTMTGQQLVDYYSRKAMEDRRRN